MDELLIITEMMTSHSIQYEDGHSPAENLLIYEFNGFFEISKCFPLNVSSHFVGKFSIDADELSHLFQFLEKFSLCTNSVLCVCYLLEFAFSHQNIKCVEKKLYLWDGIYLLHYKKYHK